MSRSRPILLGLCVLAAVGGTYVAVRQWQGGSEMRSAALPAEHRSETATATRLDAGDFRDVQGWPGWRCRDVDGDESEWFSPARGDATVERYAGACATWAHAAPIEARNFARVPTLHDECDAADVNEATSCERGPADWWCSDSPDETGKMGSLWFRVADGPAAAMVLAGSCAAWAEGEPPSSAETEPGSQRR